MRSPRRPLLILLLAFACAIGGVYPVLADATTPVAAHAPGGLFKRIETRFFLSQIKRHASPEQAAVIDQALASPAALDQIGTDIIDHAKAEHGATNVGKIGDGTFLKMLLANLPQFIAMIAQIMALFPKTPA